MSAREHDRLCSLPWEHRVAALFAWLRRVLRREWCCDCQLEPWNRRRR